MTISTFKSYQLHFNRIKNVNEKRLAWIWVEFMFKRKFLVHYLTSAVAIECARTKPSPPCRDSLVFWSAKVGFSSFPVADSGSGLRSIAGSTSSWLDTNSFSFKKGTQIWFWEFCSQGKRSKIETLLCVNVKDYRKPLVKIHYQESFPK